MVGGDGGNLQSETARFWADVRTRLIAESARPGATLQKVLTEMRGVFPVDAFHELAMLGIYLPFGEPLTVQPERPVPDLHPLDYEWYFERSTSLEVAHAFASSSGPIACLGAPTVAHALADLKISSALFDKNPLAMQRAGKRAGVERVLVDASRSITYDRHIGGVFFDAPWYPEYVLYWLWQASRLLKGTGRIAFSLFPEFTRPSASYERQLILGEAKKLGVVSIRKNELVYETPSFELEALKPHKLECLTNWRRADLVIIDTNAIHEMAEPIAPGNEGEWGTFVIGHQVIKLKRTSTKETNWLLRPVSGVSGYVFDTVSRRAPVREHIQLWTSRNRVASVGNRTVVHRILEVMSKGNALKIAIANALPEESDLGRKSAEDMFSQVLGVGY